jgi:uncharacterized protein YbjT (DUF2867 family)
VAESATVADLYQSVRLGASESLAGALWAAFTTWAPRPAFATIRNGTDPLPPFKTYARVFAEVHTLARFLWGTKCPLVVLSFTGDPELLYKFEAACVLAGLCSCCVPANLDLPVWKQCVVEAEEFLGRPVAAVVNRSVAKQLAGWGHLAWVVASETVDVGVLGAVPTTPPDLPPGVAATSSLVKYSSGSTGRPKGVRVTSAGEFVRETPHRPPVVSLSCFPPCWSTDTSVVWTSILQGARVVFGDPRHLDVLDMHRVARPSSAILTPHLALGLQRLYLATADDHGGRDSPKGALAGALAVQRTVGDRCRSLVVGGAAVPPALLRFLREVLWCRVTESYGTTEAHGITSDGVVLDGVRVRLRPLEGAGGPVDDPTDVEIGEVCVATDLLVKRENWVGGAPEERYLEDGFFRTGDVGRLNPATRELQLLGRVANAVKLPTGVFFCPEELEKALVPSVDGLEAVVVVVDGEGRVGVHVTLVHPGSMDESECLTAVSQAAARARLPVPSWVQFRGIGDLVQHCGTWKSKRPETPRKMVGRLLGVAEAEVPGGIPLRDLGLTSLSAMQVMNALGPSVTFADVLSSTMEQLEAIADRVHTRDEHAGAGGGAAGAGSPQSPKASPPVELVEPHALEWTPPPAKPPALHVFFVTGGTGFVGQGIVSCLLAHPKVRQVWCLVRKTSRTPEAWRAPSAEGRLVCVVGDIAAPNMGLPTNMGAIPTVFTAVIHAAADVKTYDLRGGLSLLHPTNVVGTANVLAFAAARAVTRFVHVSTTSVEDPGSNAYAATKFGAEELVQRAGGPTIIARLPLVLGNNPEDWLHRMADACVAMGARPACDALWARPVWACSLEDCAQDLVRWAGLVKWVTVAPPDSRPPDPALKVVHVPSTPALVADLLQTQFPDVVAGLPAVNDIAWVHAARRGTRYAPLA